jgi:site-specific DNA recombinase
MTTRSQNSRAFLNRAPPAMGSDAEHSTLRAVIYARVSSMTQRDRQTIASQISTLPTFVASRGWKLVRPPETYVDDGRTAMEGFLSKRTSFTRLIQDAARGLFDVVVIVDMDRLTRSEDLRERGEVLGAFQRAGVQLAISSTGQVLDLRSSAGDLMSSLGTYFAAEANRKHRERICRGKDEAIRKGKKPAGPTPFGYLYNRETATWSIDPELGPIVGEIFARVSSGETCETIARDLQARGVPCARRSKTGKRRAGYWIRERVHKIVRARTYLGQWLADKRRALGVPVPRIVSDRLYAQADAALRRAGRRGQPRNRHQYFLQGISTCGICGARIGCASNGGWSVGGSGKRNFYYVCSKRRRPRHPHRACSLPMLRSDMVDRKLWDAVVASVVREDHLEKAIAECESEAEGEPDPKALPRLEAKLKQLMRAEEVLLERFGRGMITDSLLDKELIRLSKDRAAVTQSIDAAKADVQRRPSADATAEALRAAVGDLRDKLRFATPGDRRDIVRAVLGNDENAVKIGPDRIEARLLLAPRVGLGVAQVYVAG